MTDAQLEALALLVDESPRPTSRTTADGCIGSRVGRSLVDLGYAIEHGASAIAATDDGRRAYDAAMGRDP